MHHFWSASVFLALAALLGGTTAGQERKRSLEVRAVNSKTGRPEPGVAIRVLIGGRFGGNTDHDGRFTIPLAEGQVSRLEFGVQKSGFVSLQVAWDNTAGAAPVEIPRAYTIKLEPGATIGGIVEDDRGRPIAGADVSVSCSTSGRARAGEPRILVNLNHQARTDQAGRWRFDEVPAQHNFMLISITHPDYAAEGHGRNVSLFITSARELSGLRAQSDITVLKEGVTVRGRVRDNGGKPIEGAQILEPSSPIRRSATTDAEGRFELAHLSPGEHQLLIQAKGFPPATEHVVAAQDMGPFEITLQTDRTISGQVVDRRKKPIPGAQVSFDPGDFAQDNPALPTTSTDGNGHFQIDITDDPGSLVAGHDLYQATRLLLPSDKDVTIVLRTQPVIVRGEVTDSGSGQPVPTFVVITKGLMAGRTPSTAGRYEIKWPNSTLPLHGSLWVGIKAEGFATTEFRPVPMPADRDEVVMNFRLNKAAPVVGVIRAPDGAPLADAEIGLSSPSTEPEFRLQFRIDEAHLVPNTDQYSAMKTDAAGRFTIPASEGRLMMLVAHPRGYAIRSREQLVGKDGSPIEVVLEPWGRIEGTLRVGERIGANESVSIMSVVKDEAQERFVSQHLETRTDSQGRFAFDQVLPGLMRLTYSVVCTPGPKIPMSPIPAIPVKPGETTRLELGRIGRPVIGRLAIPETVEAPSGIRFWGSLYQSRQPPEPLRPLTIEEKKRRTQEETMTYRSYGLCIQPDGSFRTEDVTPGKYLVHATLVTQNDRGQGFINTLLGAVHQEIVVPEIPGNQEYTSEPFDAGSLVMKPAHRLDVGQLAPDFQVTSLDAKLVRISDFRGKYLMIVFWSKSFQSDVSLAESRNLRALHKTFGKLGRFTMLGINYDDEVDRTRSLIAQRGWDWPNASVSYDVWDKLHVEYALPRYGSVWLLGPDGKVLARDLRGDVIRQAGTMVLRAR